MGSTFIDKMDKEAALLLGLEDKQMSKKVSIIISVILFVILAVLLVCEKMNPGAGSALLQGIF